MNAKKAKSWARIMMPPLYTKKIKHFLDFCLKVLS